MTSSIADFARRLPKAELHLHIEGTLEPEMLLELSQRNRVPSRHGSVESLRAAYRFRDLQSFLDIYYEGANALREEADFYDLAAAYFARASADGVRHAELFFDPQTHTARGIRLDTVLAGLERAMIEAGQRYGMSSGLILCFLRHLSADEAMATLDEAWRFRSMLLGVGLDSSEVGHPPSKFESVFSRARSGGLHVVAHAGEEGPPDYVWQALDRLGAERIDHGVRCLEDPVLVARLRREQVPLTVCPLSNRALRVVPRLEEHPFARLLEAGLVASIHSDDPAYFGGYIGAAYAETAAALTLSAEDLRRCARHSIVASFLPAERKRGLLAEIDATPDPA